MENNKFLLFVNNIVHTNKGIKMERIRLEISKIGLSKLARLKLIKPLKDDHNTLYEKTDKTITRNIRNFSEII